MFGAAAFGAARDACVPPRYLFNRRTSMRCRSCSTSRSSPPPLHATGCLEPWMRAHPGAGHDRAATEPRKKISTPDTFDAVEPEDAALLRQPQPGGPPVYPIGPLILTDNDASKALRAACSSGWTGRQPEKSVIFISFGSGGALPQAWNAASSASCGWCRADEALLDGFLDRTRSTGLVVSLWALQIEVLAHAVTGGFLRHCGWNSALESLVHGVPMVAWPLFAEQRLNAVMLSEGAGVAIRVPGDGKDREAIAAVVRELMVGEGKGATVRSKVAELQVAAKDSLCESGPGTSALDELVKSWELGKD